MIKKAIFLCFIAVCLMDFFNRVSVSSHDAKSIDAQSQSVSAVVLNAPDKPEFNPELFGQLTNVAKVNEQSKDKPKPKQKPIQATVLAIYTTPTPFAYISFVNSKDTQAKRMKVGDEVNGFKLTSIEKEEVVFEVNGSTTRIKMFKGQS
ncbi:hypothetical protein V1358_15105 [Pseudoalteromonas sp. YIC-656]|uniref:hypothetical protein n=1 Tax=Pseudoalteromonas pernae TaxID=3118054 RepID=UPI003242C176